MTRSARVRWALAGGILTLALAAAAWVATTPAPAPGLALEPCHLDGLPEQVRCGVHEVFEDRDAGTGRRIPIHVAVLPARGRPAAADPLVLLAGGPGQGARDLARAAPFFREVRRTRDLVLVDLRGTGASHPLTCPEPPDDLDAFSLSPGFVHACLAGLEADPRLYTHAAALADLHEVLTALGYARVNLWGGSWGTRAALLYAARFPEAVRSVVLDGAVPLTMPFPDAMLADGERALGLALDACAADSACAASFPDAAGLFDAALDAADAAGALAVRHPRTAAAVRPAIDPRVVAGIVRVALYTPADTSLLPPALSHAARGDVGPLLAMAARARGWSLERMALGTTLAILCSEDVPRRAASASGARSPFRAAADEWRAACAAWPRGPALEVPEDVVLDTPALILSGRHDPVTPPARGEQMGRHFANHAHVVVPHAAHNTSFTGCVPDLIAAFVEQGSPRGLDVSCVDEVAPIRFATRVAGGQP